MLIPLDHLIQKHRLQIHGVTHIGAHMGEEHDAYAAAGVQEVLWVEGDPSVFERLEKKFADVSSYQLVNAVVSDEEGKTVRFNIANNEESSSILKMGTHLAEHPEVHFVNEIEATTRTLDSIHWDQWIEGRYKYRNFLNLDIQGAELLALKGGPDALEEMDYIYTEVNVKELYVGCALLPELDAHLRDFRRVETSMTSHGWGDAFYVRKS